MKRNSENLGWPIAAAAVLVWFAVVLFLSDGFTNFGPAEWFRLSASSAYVLLIVRVSFLWSMR